MTIQPSPRSIEGLARRQDGTIRSYRRYLIGGGALILVLAAFYWWTHSGNQAGPRRTPVVPVQVVAAQQRDMAVVKDTIGTVMSPTTVSVIPRVQGQLTRIYFREGQMVKTGDLLFQIDPRPYQAALAQAKGQFAKDQGALDQRTAPTEALCQSLRAVRTRYRPSRSRSTRSPREVDTRRWSKPTRPMSRPPASIWNSTEIRSPVDGKTGPILLQPGNLVFGQRPRRAAGHH